MAKMPEGGGLVGPGGGVGDGVGAGVGVLAPTKSRQFSLRETVKLAMLCEPKDLSFAPFTGNMIKSRLPES